MDHTDRKAYPVSNVQANLISAVKSDAGLARNRAFYVFFRKMGLAEQDRAKITVAALIRDALRPAPADTQGALEDAANEIASDETAGREHPNSEDQGHWKGFDRNLALTTEYLGGALPTSESAQAPEIHADTPGEDPADGPPQDSPPQDRAPNQPPRDRFLIWLAMLVNPEAAQAAMQATGGLNDNATGGATGGAADLADMIGPDMAAVLGENAGMVAGRIAEIIRAAGPGAVLDPMTLSEPVTGIHAALDLILHPDALFQGGDAGQAPPLFMAPTHFDHLLTGIALRDLSSPNGPLKGTVLAAILASALVRATLEPDTLPKVLAAFGSAEGERGLFAFRGGLILANLYQILRDAKRAFAANTNSPAVQATTSTLSADDGGYREDDGSRIPPLNIAFTHSGLKALNIDAETLASFPDAFKDGMAMRAERLGDVGPSAPEYWDGALGLKLIHGYLNFSYPVGDRTGAGTLVPETVLTALRQDVAAHTAAAAGRGQFLRVILNAIYTLAGLKVIHVEFGEDPYHLSSGSADGEGEGQLAKPLDYRIEHFGFRDGISQPFVDFGKPKPGAGTPSRNNTWDPVPAGEMLLDGKDVDGNSHIQPINQDLREGSTYVVFRKLEQDVAGFRSFLKTQRPENEKGQNLLAAQMVGRWQSGASLVQSPNDPVTYGADQNDKLNDFLYVRDDPKGAKCPLGAHARRANPRDIGRDEMIRRHRLLRRGIPYGGALLPNDSTDRGTPRGMLFVAVNARIETQFELIQMNWLNNGDFFGQAGLGKCPLTGANNGTSHDRFFEAGEAAPVTGIPSFVQTKGGDYFFAPGVAVLKKIAAGHSFAPDERNRTGEHRKLGYGDVDTPAPFETDRITRYVRTIAGRKSAAIKVDLPGMAAHLSGNPDIAPTEDPATAKPVVFVGRHADVVNALQMPEQGSGDTLHFSVEHYRQTGRRISRGHELLVGTEFGDTEGEDTGPIRVRMLKILEDAWNGSGAQDPGFPGPNEPGHLAPPSIEAAVEALLQTTKSRTATSGCIDLVHDLAVEAVYSVVRDVFGVPGPDWLTELAIAIPFAKQHVGQIHPDWLASLSGGLPGEAGLRTMQIWSLVQFADIIGNVRSQNDLKALSLQAASEMQTHIDLLLHKARLLRSTAQPARTLLERFVQREQAFLQSGGLPAGYGSEEYYADVRMLLMEIIGTSFAAIPFTFGSVMKFLMTHDVDLAALPDKKFGDGTTIIQRVVYEATRLDPNIKMLMRRCVATYPPEGSDNAADFKIQKGEWVGALIAAANLDHTVFPNPLEFLPTPVDPACEGPGCPILRHSSDYLLFGAAKVDPATKKVIDRNRSCWGRDKMAMHIVTACIDATRDLGRMRRVPGPNGEPREFAGVMIGLPAKFPRAR